MPPSTEAKESCEPRDPEAGTVPKTGRRKRPTVPLDQRKRAKKACEPCRRDKLKCNGQSPCSRCSKTQKECLYANVTPLPDGNMVPQRVETIQQEQEHKAEKLRLLERIFAELHPNLRTDDLTALRNYGQSIAGQIQTVRPEETKTQPQDLIAAPQSEELGEGLGDHRRHEGIGKTPMPTATITVINQGKTHFEGRFSSWTFFNSARHIVSGGQAHSNDSGGDEDESLEVGDSGDDRSDPLLHQLPTIQCSPDLKTMVLAALPPRDVVDFLVATFFRSAQGNQFYIHPEIFSRKLSALYNGTHEFDPVKASDSKRSNEFICLMFIVFAIGSQFAEVETSNVESGRNYPSGQSSGHPQLFASASTGTPILEFSQLKIPKPSKSPGWRFYEVSRRLLADVVVSSSMTSVQACVLQGIFLPSAKSRDAGYNLLGLALRMAVNMGMHRSFGTESLHAHVRELRNRLWWSVYVAERIFSVEMGRPLAINDAEIDAPLPTDMPEWGDPTGKSPANVDGLIAMVKLCHLLGKIVDTVYCKPASGEGTIMSPRVFRQLQDELEQSRNILPARLRPSSGNVMSRSVAHVSLAYEQATILLTRSCLNYAAVTNHSCTLSDAALDFVRQQAQTCVKSAVTTIRLMFSLRARSHLCRFSFHDSLYCTAAVYVLLLGKSLEWLSSDVVTESIHQGVLILLDLAEGSELAASALKHILRGLQKDMKSSEGTSDGIAVDEESKLEKGRKAWKAWVSQSLHGSLDRPTVASDADSENVTAAHSEEPRDPPALFDERSHGPNVLDLPPFWVLEDSDFNIFGRDLTAAPDIPVLGNYNFL
ncbi:hypothetical protein N0V93_000020 [Gnomoniopsis smithogilvyi]|uniref:Zn(2)-C6 fungal-type domain-containing protein n=1 Tax=Gnomoniopsis smithogilvyi TaxID=1191159 RepID=A0A9W8Z0T6_9PEZI|nr:hypothetical protein N0V93_000020 [Gnomoniopsis smithogilvyi]